MLEKFNKPIIGSGFLASNLKKYVKYLKKYKITIYAAGISNSLEINQVNLNREILKIKKFIKINKKKLVYISTYSVCDESRKGKLYVKNKIKIEKIIKKTCKNYIIIRLPEIIGKNNNSSTLTNFLFKKIKNKKSFILYRNVRRNLLDVDDALYNCIKVIKSNLKKNKTINLLNKRFYTPLTIVKMLEKILDIKGLYKVKYIENNSFNLKDNYLINFKKDYLKKILRKYYKR